MLQAAKRYEQRSLAVLRCGPSPCTSQSPPLPFRISRGTRACAPPTGAVAEMMYAVYEYVKSAADKIEGLLSSVQLPSCEHRLRILWHRDLTFRRLVSIHLASVLASSRAGQTSCYTCKSALFNFSRLLFSRVPAVSIMDVQIILARDTHLRKKISSIHYLFIAPVLQLPDLSMPL